MKNKFLQSPVIALQHVKNSAELLDFSKLKTLGQVLVLFSKIVDQRASPGKRSRNL